MVAACCPPRAKPEEDMMKVIVSTLCAAVLALSPVASIPAHAGSVVQPATSGVGVQASVLDNLVQVRSGQRYHPQRRGIDRRGVHRRGYSDRSRRAQPPRRVQPQRHSRSHRSGPDLGSAVVGAIIGGIIVHQFQQQSQPRYQPRAQPGSFLSHDHINWCRNRWRSYRVTDNSYQPYNGPRRICVSPYGPS
jgi:hypothetical protein